MPFTLFWATLSTLSHTLFFCISSVPLGVPVAMETGLAVIFRAGSLKSVFQVFSPRLSKFSLVWDLCFSMCLLTTYVTHLPIPNIYFFLRMISKFSGLLIPLRTAICFSRTSTQYKDGALLTVWNSTLVKLESYPSPGKPVHWSMIISYVNPL
jgi:hypothetical protein